jgi:hypothetical protein
LSSEKLDERELRIFEYIRNNPGRSKEDVARGMNGNPSRITVLNILGRLEKEERITARRPKPNSQIYELFVNEKNLVASLTLNITEFEKAFFILLDSVNQKFSEREANLDINNNDNTDSIDDTDISELKYIREKYRIIESLITLYRHYLGMYFLHATFKWSKIADKQTLDKLHRLFYNSIEKAQRRLFDIKIGADRSHLISDPITYNLFELKPDKLDDFFKYFQGFGLTDQADKVLNNLWDMSSNFVLPTFYIHYMQQKNKRPIGPLPRNFYKNSPILNKMNKATDWRTAIKIWKSITFDQK